MRLLASINDLTGWSNGEWEEGPELSNLAYARMASMKDPLREPLKVRARLDRDGLAAKYSAISAADKERLAFAIISGYAVVPVEVVEVDQGVVLPTPLEEEEE